MDNQQQNKALIKKSDIINVVVNYLSDICINVDNNKNDIDNIINNYINQTKSPIKICKRIYNDNGNVTFSNRTGPAMNFTQHYVYQQVLTPDNSIFDFKLIDKNTLIKILNNAIFSQNEQEELFDINKFIKYIYLIISLLKKNIITYIISEKCLNFLKIKNNNFSNLNIDDINNINIDDINSINFLINYLIINNNINTIDNNIIVKLNLKRYKYDHFNIFDSKRYYAIDINKDLNYADTLYHEESNRQYVTNYNNLSSCFE